LGGLLLALGWGVGCATNESPAAATLRYVLEAPLCGSMFPVVFLLNADSIGSDTLRIHLPPDHVQSEDFSVAPGQYLIGARVPGGFVWPDTLVSLTDGALFTDTLPFYCS